MNDIQRLKATLRDTQTKLAAVQTDNDNLRKENGELKSLGSDCEKLQVTLQQWVNRLGNSIAEAIALDPECLAYAYSGYVSLDLVKLTRRGASQEEILNMAKDIVEELGCQHSKAVTLVEQVRKQHPAPVQWGLNAEVLA